MVQKYDFSGPWLGVKFFSPFAREQKNSFQICLVFTNDFPRIDVVGCVVVGCSEFSDLASMPANKRGYCR